MILFRKAGLNMLKLVLHILYYGYEKKLLPVMCCLNMYNIMLA